MEYLCVFSKLESLEVGKTYVEAKGEIIEYIHICEYATGMARGACGAKIPSERENHQLVYRNRDINLTKQTFRAHSI